ncbi:MAG TPA: thioesterase family protein [Streptosporangiaceae bacterium]|nr:thioesterase family protein [Streptosporangiaceae bacterium]
MRFSEVSAVVPSGPGGPGGPGGYTAEVDAQWTIAGKPNGGYLLAMLGRAAAGVAAHPDVLTASACYLRAPEPGPVAIEAEVLREGRSATQVTARMSQESRMCVAALLTLGRLDPDAKPYWQAGLPEAPSVPRERCVRLPVPRGAPGGRPPVSQPFPVAIMRQIEVRLEPETLRFADGRPSGRGELRGWLSLPDDEPFDPVSLLFALDAFPPATFDIAMSGWVPTLEFTAYIRAVPAPGPVRVLHRAQLIQDHRVDEACFVWDSAGHLVAQSTQLAAIRLT